MYHTRCTKGVIRNIEVYQSLISVNFSILQTWVGDTQTYAKFVPHHISTQSSCIIFPARCTKTCYLYYIYHHDA